MNHPFIQEEELENSMGTAEVVIPSEEQVQRDFSEFIPMIVSIVAMINIIASGITGKPLIPLADEQVYLVASGAVAIATIVWTAWKNTSFSKKSKQREFIANQVMSKPKVSDIFK